MPKSVAILAENLSIRKQGQILLNKLSFEIKEGEYVGIVGPNGGGKTTLLRAILGLQKFKGKLDVLGHEAGSAESNAHVGYVPQHLIHESINLPLTVEEAVATGLVQNKTWGRLPQNAHERIVKSLKQVNMLPSLKKSLQQLSGGERQRIFLARALVRNPKILILDEPLSAVDEPSRNSFYKLLDDLNKHHGMTIVLVSHDIETVAEKTTKLFCINKTLTTGDKALHHHTHV